MAVEPFLRSRPQQGFFGTTILQAIAVLILVGIVFGKVAAVKEISTGSGNYKTLPCYLSLFALAELFVLAITIDALKLRNIIQLTGILIFQIAMMVFAALQVRQTKTAIVTTPNTICFTTCGNPGSLWSEVQPLLIAVPCVLAASWVALVWWTRALYFEFGWAVFHVVGANPVMKQMYLYYQVMICLLKFDFFAFVGITMQLLILVIDRTTPEFGLTIAAIPIVMVLLITCGIAVKREIKWLMIISQILMVAALSYFVFKFVRYYSPSTSAQYASTRTTLSVFTAISFLLVLTTFAVGLRCYTDFDKGLRNPKTNDALTPRRTYGSKSGTPGSPGSPGMTERNSSYMGGMALSPRMSIE